ncbi:hypothetical protein F8M41_012243 [Gigaspora margarita]|uniref:Uncharacterized protein n=1 Tax=Gigaspora margarita TaxID=4874 RepID=A0A8H4B3Z1_GIGMA|nr:hypothetical protein F8M41_012243 [Gigaspora margarita]
MSRAYQIHLEQIEAHDVHYPSPLATEVIQVTNPDLSCTICFPPTVYYSQFHCFWLQYQPAYSATSYTQQTIGDQIITALLRHYTRFTLCPILPDNFEANTFELYIEGPTQSTPFQTHPDNPLANLPVSQIYQENNQDLEFSISSIPQSIFTLAPEVTTPQLPVVTELYQTNPTLNTTPLTTPPLHRQPHNLFGPRPASTDHQIIKVPQVNPLQPNVLVEQPNQTPNTTPIDPPPLQVQPLEEVNLEVNLQEQENPNEELIESEEEPEDLNQEEVAESEESEEELEEPNPEELIFSDSESDATVEDPEPERNMAEDAMNAAAAAITALADAMG